jgi:rubredoxin
MKKQLILGWSEKIKCQCGKDVEVFYTVPDFGDCEKLFICPGCETVFAFHPEEEFYSHTPFEKLKERLHCPVCRISLNQSLPYPKTFICPDCKTKGSFTKKDNIIPPYDEAVRKGCFTPYKVELKS